MCVCVFFLMLSTTFAFASLNYTQHLIFFTCQNSLLKKKKKVSTFNTIMWAIAKRDQFHRDFTLVELNVSYLLRLLIKCLMITSLSHTSSRNFAHWHHCKCLLAKFMASHLVKVLHVKHSGAYSN